MAAVVISRGGKSPIAAVMEANFSAVKSVVHCDEVAANEVYLRQEGRNMRGKCPLPGHDGDSPSFYVYDNGQGVYDSWYCHRCCEGGDVFDLWGKLYGLGHTPQGAMLQIADRYKIKLWSENELMSDTEKQNLRLERRAAERVERVFTERYFEKNVMPYILQIEDPEERRVELEKALKIAGLDR
jgi:DNA primase